MKLIVSKAEAIEIIREHQRLGPRAEIEIAIAEDNATQGDTSGWTKVPYSWQANFPPELAAKHKLIKVKFRNGEVQRGSPDHWTSAWAQDGCSKDIVEYKGI